MSDRAGTSSRIAIKLGATSTSNGSTGNKHIRPSPSSLLGKRHRPHALNGVDSASEGEEEESHIRHEAITTYGPGGASSDEHRDRRRRDQSTSPYRESTSGRRGHRDDRDRRESSKQQNSSLKETDLADKDKPVKWGLTINKKPRREDGNRASRAGSHASAEIETWNGDGAEKKPKSADDEALEALLGNDDDKKKRVIGNSDPDRDPEPEDYERVPIDDFGAHLLKGFGWDGKMRGKVKEVSKHANLTGLGAKSKGAEDLGAWSQKSLKEGSDKPRRPRLDEYRREEDKKRQRREERREERDRDPGYRRDRERERDRDRRDRDRERS